MNLSILPPILEEEMLSAYINRLLSVHPRLTKRTVVETIFGRPWRDASVQLPKHIDWAAKCFGDSLSSDTTSQWIAAHTLYPFFANFLGEPAQQKLYLRMASGGYGPLHQCGGRLLPRRKFFRVCEECARSDIDEFGFYRIFRSHMVCYVNCCAVHNRTLIEVVECNAWSVPPDSTCFNNTPHPRALLISRIASELIQRQPQLGLKNALHEETAVGLNMLGLLTLTSRLKMRLVLSLLREHYANVPLSAPFRETLNSSHLDAYIRSTIASKRCIHPAAYLLLAAFIQECSGELANRAPVTTMSLCERNPRPTQEELYRALEDFKTLRNASVFLNSSVTTLSVVARKYGLDFGFRPSSATDGVRQKAIGLLRGGLPPSLVAKQLQISISAVYRIRRANPELVSELSGREFHWQRTRRRELFLALAITHPGLGGAALRARDKSLWAWLYRNDRVWLTEHTPEKSRSQTHVHHSLWPRLETMLLPIIEEAIHSMVARKHERITLTALFRAAGVRQIAQQKLVEMPALRVLIESALEDPASYVNRRLLKAAHEVGASYSTSFSAIIRAATLRPTTVQRAGVDATSWHTLFASRRAPDAE